MPKTTGFATMSTWTGLRGSAGTSAMSTRTSLRATGFATMSTWTSLRGSAGTSAMSTRTGLRATGLAVMVAVTTVGGLAVITTMLAAMVAVSVTAMPFPSFPHAFKTFPYALNHLLAFTFTHIVPSLPHAVQSLPHGGTP